ncbi:hypothetical protein FRB95_014736 [Tulasnella sp. JGI-2019a]|nr:hypothetical protein FRB95_014736 [Tulasnella sp. JGI-2019a]
MPILFNGPSNKENSGFVKALTTDRVTVPPSFLKSVHDVKADANRIQMSMPYPYPAPAPQRVPNNLYYGAPPLGPSSPRPNVTTQVDANGEAFDAGAIIEKSADDTQKQLMKLAESSIGAEEVVDMEQSVVEGFASKYKLLPHQVHGRIWITERETGKKAGGILGDMGLGKTCQTICRIVDFQMANTTSVAREAKKWGRSTLIFCPQAVVGQWESEIKKMAPKLRTHVHHGPSRTKNAVDFANLDVVVTTYKLIQTEFGNYEASIRSTVKDESNNKAIENDSGSEDSEFLVAMAGKEKGSVLPKKHTALFDAKFLRIVLYEAHTIKNRLNKTSKACCELKARFRWCPTGTPIQNTVEDLYPLMHFLRIRPLNEWETFKTQIANPIKAGKSQIPMKRLQVVLSAIMLRRKKTDIVNGKPILALPGRTVALVECEFEQDEFDFYTAMVERTEVTLNKFAKPGAQNAYANVLVLLLRLRQACCHPELCLRNVKDDAEALDMKVKSSDKDEEQQDQEEANELADMMAGLEVKETKCEICRDVFSPGVKSKHCPDCELNIIVKARHKSTANIEAKDDTQTKLPSSTKIRKLSELLKEIGAGSEGKDKAIIFSQFTSFLDIIQKFLEMEGFKLIRYHGKMGRNERDDALEKFRTSSRYNVALVSLMAGSAGLNLTAANNVVLMDLWWNPALEDQAFDRAHRYGQKKEVFIYKLVVPNTVEERIQALQAQKRDLGQQRFNGPQTRQAVRYEYESGRALEALRPRAQLVSWVCCKCIATHDLLRHTGRFGRTIFSLPSMMSFELC